MFVLVERIGYITKINKINITNKFLLVTIFKRR